MSASIIRQLYNHCKQTFGCKLNPVEFKSRVESLCKLVQCLKVEDLNFDMKLVENDKKYIRQSNIAPVTYIPIHHGDFFTICIFVLKNGTTLPLHDHPKMCGILKVLHGQVYCKCFSNIVSDYDKDFRDELPGDIRVSLSPEIIVKKVLFEKEEYLTNKDYCHLTAEYCNYHYLKADKGPAAFLDVLAPPYSSTDRQCRFYQECFSSNIKGNQFVYLTETSSGDYWCDEAPYLGEPLY